MWRKEKERENSEALLTSAEMRVSSSIERLHMSHPSIRGCCAQTRATIYFTLFCLVVYLPMKNDRCICLKRTTTLHSATSAWLPAIKQWRHQTWYCWKKKIYLEEPKWTERWCFSFLIGSKNTFLFLFVAVSLISSSHQHGRNGLNVLFRLSMDTQSQKCRA